MPIAKNELQHCLEKSFPNANISYEDLAGDNDHWQITIISKAFQGKSKLAQHRLVHEAVAHYDIHALSIKTSIPKE